MAPMSHYRASCATITTRSARESLNDRWDLPPDHFVPTTTRRILWSGRKRTPTRKLDEHAAAPCAPPDCRVTTALALLNGQRSARAGNAGSSNVNPCVVRVPACRPEEARRRDPSGIKDAPSATPESVHPHAASGRPSPPTRAQSSHALIPYQPPAGRRGRRATRGRGHARPARRQARLDQGPVRRAGRADDRRLGDPARRRAGRPRRARRRAPAPCRRGDLGQDQHVQSSTFSGLGINPHYGTPGQRRRRRARCRRSSSGRGVSVGEGTSEISIGVGHPADRAHPRLGLNRRSSASSRPPRDATDGRLSLVLDADSIGSGWRRQVAVTLARRRTAR